LLHLTIDSPESAVKRITSAPKRLAPRYRKTRRFNPIRKRYQGCLAVRPVAAQDDDGRDVAALISAPFCANKMPTTAASFTRRTSRRTGFGRTERGIG
jgi:hypothetical protein